MEEQYTENLKGGTEFWLLYAANSAIAIHPPQIYISGGARKKIKENHRKKLTPRDPYRKLLIYKDFLSSGRSVYTLATFSSDPSAQSGHNGARWRITNNSSNIKELR
tara:strand:- start:1709 stop:2029 length:321 start_codon:yes stop_codon:yes gene_type:complete